LPVARSHDRFPSWRLDASRILFITVRARSVIPVTAAIV
jgi:hypothetical protein